VELLMIDLLKIVWRYDETW